MNLTELFKQKTVFSLEVFPPKKDSPQDAILPTLNKLELIKPDFISCTLGAGGSASNSGTVEITNVIENQLHTNAIAHVPCLYKSKQEVLDLLDQLSAISVTNILALRGDLIPGKQPVGDFHHANELIEFIKVNRPQFHIAAACYPNCHNDATDFVDDIANLKHKVDCGVDHLISQLFFNNNDFYNFREKAAIAGINVPIEAGIMPCTNKKSIERIAQISGVPLPKKFQSILNRYSDSKEAVTSAGIAFAVDQIIDLVSQGVDGVHLYTMNRADIANQIWDETRPVFKSENAKKLASLK